MIKADLIHISMELVKIKLKPIIREIENRAVELMVYGKPDKLTKKKTCYLVDRAIEKAIYDTYKSMCKH